MGRVRTRAVQDAKPDSRARVAVGYRHKICAENRRQSAQYEIRPKDRDRNWNVAVQTGSALTLHSLPVMRSERPGGELPRGWILLASHRQRTTTSLPVAFPASISACAAAISSSLYVRSSGT